jgi:hypothetical protein
LYPKNKNKNKNKKIIILATHLKQLRYFQTLGMELLQAGCFEVYRLSGLRRKEYQ